ncbi:hypothetical protein OEA41_005973 [Lepraria neglecta]|uniref:Uncharacterized protein n=1 Tax=Lepraria neglecta TaxID=209136 RepID=A0AAD9Z6S0_9LECA|nr:hypothetical protein OEA41_005973 [Lepraria neglecta]
MAHGHESLFESALLMTMLNPPGADSLEPVAKRMKEKIMKIVETFHKIPETIRIAEDRLADYPDDELLYGAATGLFIAVLRAIEGMLGWLVGTSTWKMIGSILSEPLSERPVDVGLEDVPDQTERLLNRVTTLQSMAVQRIDGNLENVKGGAETIRSSAQHTEKMTGAMHTVVNETYPSVHTMKSKIFQRLEAQTGMLSLLQEENRKSEWNRKRDALEIQSLKKEIQMTRLEAVKQRHKPELEPLPCMALDFT